MAGTLNVTVKAHQWRRWWLWRFRRNVWIVETRDSDTGRLYGRLIVRGEQRNGNVVISMLAEEGDKVVVKEWKQAIE